MHYYFHLSLFVLLLSYTAEAQITITYSDVKTALAPGKTFVHREDTLTKQINIGNLGQTSWDFTSLLSNFTQTNSSYNISYILASTAPTTEYFPSANIGQYFKQTVNGMPSDVYSFFQLSTSTSSLNLLGTTISTTIQPGVVQSMRFTKSVPENWLQLPCSLGTSWSTEFSDTIQISVGGTPTGNIEYHNNYISDSVDAYGTITFPGGAASQALRIRRDKRSTTKFSTSADITYSREISYLILTKEGESIKITAKDTTAASNGYIIADKISGESKGSTTDIITASAKVNDFRLLQNYPNPFNPETKIAFELSKAGRIELSIFNSLGQKLGVIAEGNYPPGRFEKSFNGSGLSSGIYFYVLTTDNLVLRQKMILMK